MSQASEDPGCGRGGDGGGLPTRELWDHTETSLSGSEAVWREADKKAVWLRRCRSWAVLEVQKKNLGVDCWAIGSH